MIQIKLDSTGVKKLFARFKVTRRVDPTDPERLRTRIAFACLLFLCSLGPWAVLAEAQLYACPGCSLPGWGAEGADLSNANLEGATLAAGNMAGVDLNGAAFAINGTVTTTTGGTVTITNSGALTIAAAGDMTLDGAFLQDGAGSVQTAGDITTTGDNITFQQAVTLTDTHPVVWSTGAGTGGTPSRARSLVQAWPAGGPGHGATPPGRAGVPDRA